MMPGGAQSSLVSTTVLDVAAAGAGTKGIIVHDASGDTRNGSAGAGGSGTNGSGGVTVRGEVERSGGPVDESTAKGSPTRHAGELGIDVDLEDTYEVATTPGLSGR